jgi:hypothetical protein
MSMKCKHFLVLVALLILGVTTAHADLVGLWKLDEGAGDVAVDSTGNGHDGTLIGGPEWVEGYYGMGLRLGGSPAKVDIPHSMDLNPEEFSATVWANVDAAGSGHRSPITSRDDGPQKGYIIYVDPGNTWQFWTGPGWDNLGGPAVVHGEWTHVGITFAGGEKKFYVNGELVAERSGITVDLNTAQPLRLGAGATEGAGNYFFVGTIDDVAVFNNALTLEEIQKAMAGLGSAELAADPNPADAAIDVPRDVSLSWKPGEFAVQHTVYLSTDMVDVNDGSATALLADNSDATTADAGVLGFGQTYYWRVDEVNAAPDRTVFTGDVWSFVVEPEGIPVESITATASAANLDMGPEKTIDGSGLNDMDQHSTQPLDMWLAAGTNPWIQYEFDKAYKLNEMLVWNSNQVIESFLGFGVKEVTIETSVDGENWTALDGMIELAKAPGEAAYAANTAVSFGGVVAQFVKLSVVNAHGTVGGQTGLSEVRFLALPVSAREPQPADGVTTANAQVALAWRSGREAVSHEISLGTDADSMTLIDTTADAETVTEPLDYGTTYLWSITEVNDAAVPTSHAGPVWTFTTPASGVVDDFESYSGDEGQEVFMTWFDGFGGDAGLGGSITGHIDGPFVETAIVYGGDQSLPIYIDNDGGFVDIDGKSSSPTFSEVVREFDSPQDWTTSNVKTLSIMFHGSTGLTGQLYCKIGSTKLVYDGDAANLGIGAWQAWNIDLSTVGGNLTGVRELAIGAEGGTSGLLYIDEIRLYPQLGELITPTEPGTASLAGLWDFDEGTGLTAQDSSGNGNNGTFESAQWVAGHAGSALEFVRADQVDCGDVLGFTDALTIACWVNPTELLGEKSFVTRHGAYVLKASGNLLRFTTPGIVDYTGTTTLLEEGMWQHVAVTFVPNQADGAVFYLNGIETQRLNHNNGTTSDLAEGTGPFQIGNNQWDQFYLGMIDDVHVYNAALSAAEILSLAGVTQPIHKPF